MFQLWCAGKLGNCPPVKRFRFTCLYCRWRRVFYNKFTLPPHWISYMFPWKLKKYAIKNIEGEVIATVTRDYTIKIDPRGHFTMLRCSIIVALDKIMNRCRCLEKPLMEICEFFSNYPTW